MKLKVSFACTGELFFAYATSDDASRGDKVYKSVVTNPYLDQSQGTSYTRVIIRDGTCPNLVSSHSWFARNYATYKY